MWWGGSILPPPPSIQGQKPLYSCFLCKKCQKYAVIFLKVCPTCCTKFHLRTLKYSKIISQRGGGYGREHSLPLDPPPIHSPCTFPSQAISILGDIQWWVVTFEWSQWELSILEFLSLREVSQRKLSAGSCPGMAFYSVSVENYENTHRTFKLSLLCWNHSYSILCCPPFTYSLWKRQTPLAVQKGCRKSGQDNFVAVFQNVSKPYHTQPILHLNPHPVL